MSRAHDRWLDRRRRALDVGAHQPDGADGRRLLRSDTAAAGLPLERYAGGFAPDAARRGGSVRNWRDLRDGTAVPHLLPKDPAVLERLGPVSLDPAASDEGEWWLPTLSLEEQVRSEQPRSASKGRPTQRRILIVDDNVDFAETTRMLLEHQQHEVRVVHEEPERVARLLANKGVESRYEVGLQVVKSLPAKPGVRD
jgi:hypothetical protein